MQDAGVPLTFGTGRTLDYLRHHFPGDVRLTHPVITTQGAIIGDPQTGHVLVEQALPLADARALADWVDRDGVVAGFYFLDRDGNTHVYRNHIGRTPDEEDLLQHLFGHPFTPL